jgi:exopolysaccharide production protein ExoQ
MSTLVLSPIDVRQSVPETVAVAPANTYARYVTRRKYFWILLLFLGFWFARPYYFPWTAAEENDADTRAVAAQGSVERQVAMPALALLACYMLWRTRNPPKFKGRLATLTVVFLAVNGASLYWSVDMATTLKRLVVFYMCVLTVVAMAKAFTVLDLARIGFYACGVAGVLAMLCDMFITKTWAPLDPEYRLMGVMSSNSQAQNLTACIFCGLTLLLKFPNRAKWMTPALGLMAMLLYFTRGRTATIACIVLSLFFLKRIIDVKYKVHTRAAILLLLLAAVVPTLILLGSKAGDVAQAGFMMGRDDTQNTASLSNRAPLWQELMDYVDDRPYVGYGYNAFWTSGRISKISADQKWGVPNAHNTYLDQELSIGIPGVILYTVVLWGALFVVWKRYRRNPSAETLLGPIMLSWLVFTTFAESIPLDPFLPTFLVYVLLAQALMPEGAAIPDLQGAAVYEQSLL